MNNPRNRLFLVVLLSLRGWMRGGARAPPARRAGGAGGAGMPAMGVEIVTLEPQAGRATHRVRGHHQVAPFDQHSASGRGVYHANSCEIGRPRAAGATLMDIDSRVQQATLEGLESVRAQREIDVTYAQAGGGARGQTAQSRRRQPDGRRSRRQRAEGGGGAAADRQTSRCARLATDLAYYRVTSPTAGVVGDIPVREGDRVTKSTLLTTVDANAGLEVYLNVPVQQAPKLRPGLPVRLVDDAGAPMAEEKDQFRFPISRHANADRARQDAGDGARHVAHRSIRSLASDLDDGAGADDSADVGNANQRPMVRVRRGARRRGQRARRAAARGAARPRRRQQLHGVERSQGWREIDHGGHSEDQGRCAGHCRRSGEAGGQRPAEAGQRTGDA